MLVGESLEYVRGDQGSIPREDHDVTFAVEEGRHPMVEQNLRRGDLVFWKGHMGVMRDAETLLHANAYFMQVTSEPLAAAIARIATPVTSIKRL